MRKKFNKKRVNHESCVNRTTYSPAAFLVFSCCFLLSLATSFISWVPHFAAKLVAH